MTAQELVHGNERSYSFIRLIADSLTLFRLLVSIFLVALAFTAGADSLKAAIILVLIAWVSDFFDGRIARNAGGKESWVGKMDHVVDNILVYSFFVYLLITGLFPLIPGFILLGASGVIIIMRPIEPVIQMVSAPLFGLPIVLSPIAGWYVFGGLASFLAVVVILNWKKLKGFATNAHHEASGRNPGELENDEGVLLA